MASSTDEPTPIRTVNPPPPAPPPVSPVLRVLSLALVLVGLALLPTGPASVGLALIGLSIALLSAVASADEPIYIKPVNPPPPRGLARLLLFHVLSLLVGAVGLYLLIRNVDGGFRTWGVHSIGAGLVLNLVDLIVNLGRYRSPGAAR